ncbi:MAG: hypothetical protein COA79_03325 [Planctomycetota bacterium]|nr:MAG: hypothetical protein COA79_03325 [Planctomycetota bacterium]
MEEENKNEKYSLLNSFKLLKRILAHINASPGQFTNLYLIVLIIAIIQLPAPFLFKSIIDNVLPTSNESLLIIIIAALVSIEIVKSIFTIISTYLLSTISQKLATNLRKKLFRHYLEIPYQYYLETPTGKMVNRMVSDTNSVADFIQHILWVVPLPIVMVSIGSTVLMVWNWQMGLYIMISIPLTMIVTKRLSKKLKAIRIRYRDAQEALQGKTNESIENIRVIRAFHREPEMDQELGHEIDIFKQIGIDHHLNSSLLRSSNRIIEIATSYLFIIFGAYLTITKQITLGEFFAFKYFQEMIAPNLNQLFNYLTELPNQTVSIERVFEILDMKIEPGRDKKSEPIKITGKIEFKNTQLTYPDKTVALENINLKINPGEIVAVIGPSGSGKTSLASLLLGFYPISGGEILIDDKHLSDYNIRDYRKKIGVIFQDAQLFDTSIRENLSVSNPDNIDDELIWKALDIANASDFVKETENGLGTIIGNKGIKLSGGQRQRLTIARVFLKNPKILIMDEATSALDSISEKEIQNQIQQLTKDRTTIIIAHRLSTISIADRIVVMEEGRIKEIGTHQELLDNDSLYKQLYASQMDGFLKWESNDK